MNVSLSVWVLTVAVLLGLLAVDLLVSGRGEHHVSMREAAIAVGCYVVLAVLFAGGLLAIEGPRSAGEFVAGWLTEYSLSVDNLFVFVVTMAAFRVPRDNQRNVLVVGVVLALILRGVFIAFGAQVITRFEWTFYLFGAFLIVTACRLAVHRSDAGFKESTLLRLAKRVLPTAEGYHGTRVATPGLPQPRPVGDPRLHRRQDGGGGAARIGCAVGRDDPRLGVPGRRGHRPDRLDRGQPAQGASRRAAGGGLDRVTHQRRASTRCSRR